MQPGAIGPKTHRLVESEATIPQCVYNMIKAVTGRPVLSFTQYMDSIALFHRSNNGATATHFNLWETCNAVPYASGKFHRINGDFRCGENGERPRLFGMEPPKPRIEAARIVDMNGSNA